jgi:hypothetical protein
MHVLLRTDGLGQESYDTYSGPAHGLFVRLFVCLRVRARRYQTGLSERWFPAEQVGRPASLPSLSLPSTLPCVLSRALPWARVLSCMSVCVCARVNVCRRGRTHALWMRLWVRACVRVCARASDVWCANSKPSLLSCGCAAHAHDVDHRADEQRRVGVAAAVPLAYSCSTSTP